MTETNASEQLKTLQRSLPENPTASFLSGRDGELTAATKAFTKGGSEVRDSAASTGDGGGAAAAPDKTDDGSYVFRKLAGKGGFGEVWEAVQVRLGRVVAIKKMRADLGDAAGGTDTTKALETEFELEAVTTARLDHPNIVPVYDFGRDAAGTPMLAMKLAAGREWADLIKDEIERLPVTEFLARHLAILVDMSQAVAFAHSRGIVHRDLKPAQVIVGEFGEVMLMDWGLAVLFDSEKLGPEREIDIVRRIPTPENASNPAGTPVVMAPEQVRFDAKLIGPWTDVYLLGATLYFLLTGSYPHRAPSSMEAMKRAMVGLVEDPEERAPDREIPAELSALAMKAMERKPKDRIASAKAFIAGIEDYLSGASRRREAEQLVEELNKCLEAPRHDYTELNELLSQQARARELFPALPGLADLRDRILGRYIRAAIDKKDLNLARTQLTRMSAGNDRDQFEREIATAEEEKRALDKQRKLAIQAIIVLLAVIAVGAMAFSWKINEERKRALAAEQRAEERRMQAENLFRFALEDLQPVLEREKKLDLLNAIADQALKYYDEEDFSQRDEFDGRRMFSSISQIGDIYEGSGNTQAAIRARRLQGEKAQQMARIYGNDNYWAEQTQQSTEQTNQLLNTLDRAGAENQARFQGMMQGITRGQREDSRDFQNR